MTVEESFHVVFYETNHTEHDYLKKSTKEDDQDTILQKMHLYLKKQLDETANQPVEILHQTDLSKEWRIPRDLSLNNIIRQIDKGVSTQNSIINFCKHMGIVS